MNFNDGIELTEGNPLAEEYGQTPEKPSNNHVLVDYVVGRFSYYQQKRLPLEKKWDEYYRTWKCIEDATDKQRNHERSKIKIPATKEAVNNAVDSIFQVTMGYPWFDVQPSATDMAGKSPEEIDQMLTLKHEQAKTIKSYLRFLFAKENIESKIHQTITDFAIYGTTIAQVVAKEKRKVKVSRSTTITAIKNPDTGEVLDEVPTENIQRTEQKVNHPELEPVPLENFYIDIAARGCQQEDNCDGMVKRSYHQKFTLYGKGYDQAELDKLGSPATPEVKADRFSKSGLSVQVHDTDVELLEWWGWIPNRVLVEAGLPEAEDGGKEMMILCANRQALLKAEENPHASGERPFIVGRFEKNAGEFYGNGIVEVASGPQKALDSTVRSRMDNKALSLNQIFGINTDNFVPGQSLGLYPGKALLFRGNPRESFFPLVVPDVTGSSYQDAAEYERYIQAAPGISRVIGGMAAKEGAQTATEVSMLVGQSNGRIKTLVKNFENDFIEPLLRWYLRIIIQFINDREIYNVTDNETGAITLHQITPDDITEDFEFVVMGSIRLVAQAQAQKRIQVLQLTANPIDAPFVNRQYQIRKVYESMEFDDEEVGLLASPPPQQAAIMAQAQQGPGVASQPQLPEPGPKQPGQMLEDNK